MAVFGAIVGAQKIEDLSESKNFFAEVFQIKSKFLLAKKKIGVRCTLTNRRCPLSLLSSQGSVQLVENVRTWFHLYVPVSERSCRSYETYLAFPTEERSRAFAINRAWVLGFRDIARWSLACKHQHGRPVAGNVPVKSKLKHRPPFPPGIPRAFDVFSCQGGREFDEFSLPGAGHLITTQKGWKLWSLASFR